MSDYKIHINPSKRSPLVEFEDGRLSIVGRSIIEKPSAFFNPIFNWLEKYIKETGKDISLYFAFEHINTSSIKWIYVLIKGLFDDHEIANKITLKWFYENGDDDLEELGLVFNTLLNKEIDIIEINSDVFDLAKNGIVNLPN